VLRSADSRLLQLGAVERSLATVPRDAAFRILRASGKYQDLGNDVYAVEAGSDLLVEVPIPTKGTRFERFDAPETPVERAADGTVMLKIDRDAVGDAIYVPVASGP